MYIKIDEDVSLEDLDIYYGRLVRATEVASRVDLLLPTKLINNFMGLVPAIYQFTITWIRYVNSGKLLLNVKNEEQHWISLLENEHLFPLIMLAWNRPGIYDSSGEINLKPALKEPVREFRKKMVKVRPMKGWKLLLISI